jgi:SAM-dependent methyltransferase
MSSPDYLAQNVASWTRTNAEYTGPTAARAWSREEITWGIWRLPEAELCMLGDVADLDVVELGCGTGYLSAWLARRGARPVGVDPTPAQLETARHMQAEFGIDFPLVEAPAESVPLPDASFDLAVSESGASLWADPYRWIPEAARLLRPGGRLVFLRTSTLAVLCSPDEDVPAGDRLVRPQFGMHRFEWTDGGVEFHLAHGDWIRLLRESGFEIEALVELQAPADATDHPEYDYVTADWGRRWPAEEIWAARKRSEP